MASNDSKTDLEKMSRGSEPDSEDFERLLSDQSKERNEALLRRSEEQQLFEVLTVGEFAKMARVSAQTVRRWLRSGKIRAHKVGLRWLIHRSEFEVAMHPAGHHELFRVQDDTYDVFFREIAPSLLCRLPSLSVYSRKGKSGNCHIVFFQGQTGKEFGVFDLEGFRSLRKLLETFTPEEVQYVFRATARDEE